ncbi:hypothetical protein [uncultured Nocardioides sp.]|uniref:hypothetical protein n=1 Tax=uncultured Nocardioides sp. TaxID=198441 RepID=UPI0030F6B075
MSDTLAVVDLIERMVSGADLSAEDRALVGTVDGTTTASVAAAVISRMHTSAMIGEETGRVADADYSMAYAFNQVRSTLRGEGDVTPRFKPSATTETPPNPV